MPRLSESCRSAATSFGCRQRMVSPSRVKFPIWLAFLQVRAQEPSTRSGLKAAHQAMKFFEEITSIPEQGRLTDSAVYVLGQEGDSRSSASGRFPEAGTEVSHSSSGSSRRCRLRPNQWFSTSGSTAGGFWSSVGEPCGSLTTGAFDQQTSHSTVKGLSQS